MSVDMSQLTDTFTSMANAIREKTGSTSAFTPAQMITEIENIPTGSIASYILPYTYTSSTITSYTGDENFILDYAFYYCSSLSNISFPECSYIGSSAFYYCTSLTTVSFPNCSYIGNNAFRYCSSLTNISFPNCSYIGSSAFNYCTRLSNISFPNCSYIGENAFQFCSSLTNISFSKCSYIGSGAFYSCTRLSSLYLLSTSIVSLLNSNAFNNTPLSATGTGKIYVPNDLYDTYITATNWSTISARITYASIPAGKYSSSTITSYIGGEIGIGSNAFFRCSSLTTVSFPECSYIGDNAFGNCTGLTNISFPKCSYIGSSPFYGCTSLTSAIFPECSYIGSSAFGFCTRLSNISFPMCNYIENNAFYFCGSLTSLYLLSTSVVSLANSNAFNFTPLSAGGTGNIYVPSGLVATYKTATNWSKLSNRITSYNG